MELIAFHVIQDTLSVINVNQELIVVPHIVQIVLQMELPVMVVQLILLLLIIFVFQLPVILIAHHVQEQLVTHVFLQLDYIYTKKLMFAISVVLHFVWNAQIMELVLNVLLECTLLINLLQHK